MHNFTPFPVLKTNRLILRNLLESDVDAIFKLRSNPETMKFIPRPLATSKEEAMNHIQLIQNKTKENEGINWAICLQENFELIGIIGHYRIKPEHFRSEIGYMLLPEFQSNGIMTEAIKEVVKYGFNEMDLNSIEGIIDPKNSASGRVLEKMVL